MERPTPGASTDRVRLRDVTEADLSVFFERQLHPEANQMGDFLARDRAAFIAHWTRILDSVASMKQTILLDGQVAGNIVSWEQDGS